MDIESLRKKIDELDEQLVQLLNARARRAKSVPRSLITAVQSFVAMRASLSRTKFRGYAEFAIGLRETRTARAALGSRSPGRHLIRSVAV